MYYCQECTSSVGGGREHLCNKVRQHEPGKPNTLTCSQNWQEMWLNGARLPLAPTNFRMRKINLNSSSEEEEPKEAADDDSVAKQYPKITRSTLG